MTKNNSNEVNLPGPIVINIIDEAQARINRLDSELKDAKVKLDAHESLWKTAQSVITQQAEEIQSLEKQLKLYKEEFSDASKNHLDAEVVIQKTKHGLESVMEQFFKHENK